MAAGERLWIGWTVYGKSPGRRDAGDNPGQFPPRGQAEQNAVG